MKLFFVALAINYSQAIGASELSKHKAKYDSLDSDINAMQIDNEADMWNELAKADPKDIVDGDLI